MLQNRTEELNVVERSGEIPECPSINMKTGQIEYLDPNDETLDWNYYMPLADLYV